MPDFPIVDSHVHLYDIARLRYPWLQGVPRINRTHLIDDFARACGEVKVDGIVFVEVAVDAGLHLDEAAFVGELAAKDARLVGMVAHAPVERGAAIEADLEALARQPVLRGIRRLIQGEMDPTICLEPAFLDGVRAVGRHGLPFDICVKHWALPAATEMVRRCPEVQFVLDHIGKPGIRLGLREPWWSGLRELAALPNVVCKLSGVITEADHARWTPQQVKPFVAHAIDCFGLGRVMYGSDWPVSALTHEYPVWVGLLDDILSGCSVDERRGVFRGTATRVYRLD
jgi:L-fuconolactonase